MKKINFIILVLIVFLVTSCTQSKEKMVKEITAMEKALFSGNNTIPDKTKVNEMVALYKKFADQHPKDSLSPVYLYKAANLQMNNSQNEDAVALLDILIKNYNDFSKLPEVYFLKAFIFENNIKNIKKAREAYTDFLQKYPKHDLADDAMISIDNLGKTPEQMVMEFEAKMKQQADSAAVAAKK
ncbi:MAG TPA: tetratricopeptide repeat protein [Bacteroidales bacterium]|nr:tetratricopeptide repeat protein [Bacteroidales bacterium]